ncbi:O-methyltransferase [Pseudonocardia sp. DLS-67]
MWVPDTATDLWALRDHVASYLAEDDVLGSARAEAERSGCVPVGPDAGAGLRFLAAAICARAVVEIGTGSGVSGLWLLRGMAPDGTLTSIDVDPEHQRAARGVFLAAGYEPANLRLINGMALEVLPRLTDAVYDMVFVDAGPADYPRYLDEAVRLLRDGGIVVFAGVLGAGVVDPDASDAGTAGLREVSRSVREDDRLVPMLLPVGDGLLAALKTG